jgi:hypothetical protein
MLVHSLQVFDDVYFYDDQSDDETPDIVAELNCSGRVRPDEVPTFVDDEGAFRAAAWMGMEEDLGLQPGDWVCVIDCDESLVSDFGADPAIVRDTMEKVITAAGSQVAVQLTIPEVFGLDEDGVPLVRMDRLWNTIFAPRLFAYRPGAQFFQGPGQFGVPSVPSYVMANRNWFGTDLLTLLHYGYAEGADQVSKYNRYTGRLGHSNEHVQSILATDKVLHRWNGSYNPGMVAAWRR